MANREERRTEAQERRQERVERSRDRRSEGDRREPRAENDEQVVDEREEVRRADSDEPIATETESEPLDEGAVDSPEVAAQTEQERAEPRKSGRAEPGTVAPELAKASAEPDVAEALAPPIAARPDAPKPPSDAPLVRALAALHADPNQVQLDLPVAATGESSDVVPTLRPDGDPTHLAAGPDEARGRPVAEPATLDAQAQPAQRFEVAARADDGRAAEAPRSQPAPTPAEQHAVDILRQLRLELALGRREAHINLEPAELGRISVKLALDRGLLRAEVRAESGDTLAVLQRHVPELRAMLEARGVTPGSFDFQLGFQDGRRGGAQDGDNRRGAQSGTREPTSVFTRAAREVRSLVRGVWGIDTYA
ncbi:MAG: flagellar hook-length control protein FliK [Planctomycetes bacterium]|nr:flagellar hook-length control protein FliK [Planctomycetota bacterium]